MEGIESFQVYLKDICHQARILAEAAVSLNRIFNAEAERLTRQDGVQRLRAILTVITRELESLRRQESLAHNAAIRARLPFSITGSILKIIVAVTTENQQALKFVNDVFADTDKKIPYGMVMICVGTQGLPDDARVVSISELSRKSKRPESEVISKLREDGHLLFSEEIFSRLIDRLINDVQEGRLVLPINPDKLSEIQSSSGAELEKKKPELIRISPP